MSRKGTYTSPVCSGESEKKQGRESAQKGGKKSKKSGIEEDNSAEKACNMSKKKQKGDLHPPAGFGIFGSGIFQEHILGELAKEL